MPTVFTGIVGSKGKRADGIADDLTGSSINRATVQPDTVVTRSKSSSHSNLRNKLPRSQVREYRLQRLLTTSSGTPGKVSTRSRCRTGMPKEAFCRRRVSGDQAAGSRKRRTERRFGPHTEPVTRRHKRHDRMSRTIKKRLCGVERFVSKAKRVSRTGRRQNQNRHPRRLLLRKKPSFWLLLPQRRSFRRPHVVERPHPASSKSRQLCNLREAC